MSPRWLYWLMLLAAIVVVVDGVARQVVDLWMVSGGMVTGLVAMLLIVGDDPLGDHPRESQDALDEMRRRRGAAGWQKPVSPPPPGSRPGGLPPRRDRG